MKLPLYVLDIDEDLNDETEVFAVGLVLQPAIERNWRAFTSEKISFDFDGTLSTSKGQDLAKQFIEKGATVYIVSARNSVSGILPTADKLGIPHSNVFAVGSNESKVAKILELSIVKHFDNNSDVINELGKVGEKFVEPSSGETQEEFISRCVKYVMGEGTEQEQAIAICYSKWENKDNKFNKQIESFKSQEFSVINEEKRLLGGFLMTADQPIYRRDEDGSEYYVTFPASAIEKIVKKMAKKGKNLTFNINHDDSQPAEQCYLISHFIVDSKLGVKTPDGFTPAKDGDRKSVV